MEPEASPLLYIATLLGLTTLSAQEIFNHNVMDGVRRGRNVISGISDSVFGHSSGDRAASEGAGSMSTEVGKHQSRWPRLI